MRINCCLAFVLVLFVCIRGYAQITVEDLVTSWEDTTIPKVSCNVASKVYRWDQAARNGPSDIFSNSLVDGPPVVNEYEGFVFRIREEGVRVSFEGVECNSYNGRGMQVSQDGENPSGTHSVVVTDASDAMAEKLFNTEIFVEWLEPASSKVAESLAGSSALQLEVVASEDYGRLASIVTEDAKGNSTSIQFAERYDWRIVSRTKTRGGKTQAKGTFKYSMNADGIPVLLRWETISFLGDAPWRMEKAEVVDVVLDCMSSDLEVEIPRNSVVTESLNSTTNQYLVRNDGTKRRFTMEETVNATSMQDLMSSNEGDLVPGNSWLTSYLALAVAFLAAVFCFRGVRTHLLNRG